ncbi:hypothetical protein HDU93_003637 [Gonapodya sp. JEL0774]|nr:hypothetical protein HDU93_003637 [Gonapodya sp. JEL0774]
MVQLSVALTANAQIKSSRKLKGAVAVAVGGTSGVGRAAALALADMGASVTIGGRNAAAAAQILEEMKKLNPDGNHDFVALDFTEQKEVHRFAEEVKRKRDRLDFLVVSAGVMRMSGRVESSDGIDTKLAVHYYSRFLLIREFLPLLQATSNRPERELRPHVLSIMAPTYASSNIKFDDMDLKKSYSLEAAASLASNYNDAMVEKFASMYPNITFTHMSPGAVATNLARDLPWYARAPLWLIGKLIGTKEEDFGQMAAYVLTEPGRNSVNSHGKNWHLTSPKGEEWAKLKYGTAEAIDKVWEHSLKMTGGN